MRASGRTLGRTSPLGLAACAALVLSACSQSSSAYSAPSAPAPSAAQAPTGGTAVSIEAKNVAPVGKVLVDQQGLTLYLLTKEKGGKIACTGSCASIWPPVALPSGSTAATAIAGAKSSLLGTVTLADGTVAVTYNGYPLHTYSGDSGPGQANGQGVQGVWFAVSPSGTKATTGSSGNSGGSGNGYGGGGGY